MLGCVSVLVLYIKDKKVGGLRKEKSQIQVDKQCQFFAVVSGV